MAQQFDTITSMTADSLTIDWSTWALNAGSMWIDASDGSVISFCIPKYALEAASEEAADDTLERVGGMQGWIDRAVRSRYHAHQVVGAARPADDEGRFVLMVQKEDFTAH
jgi:hypothetical protein